MHRSVITKIETQKRNKDRASIFIDGEFFSSLQWLAVKKHRLNEGDEVCEESLLQAVFDSECETAFEKSVSYINTRLRSEKEIDEYLKKKEFSERVIKSTLEKLTEYGFINDLEFAKFYILSYKKRWGFIKIKFELKKFGVNDEVIALAFGEDFSQADEIATILQKYFKNKEFCKNKAYVHLMQKGFSQEEIKKGIEKYLIGEENE